MKEYKIQYIPTGLITFVLAGDSAEAKKLAIVSLNRKLGIITVAKNLKWIKDEPATENSQDCCSECKKPMDEMEHNYGTEDILCCIHCYQLAQES